MNFNGKKIVFGILGVLFFLNIFAWIAVYDLSQQRFLEVTFFDVGQGDAIFIETNRGHQILIDGGPSSVILEKLAREMPFYDRTIDLIVLTHPEKDHMTGLLEVLKRYKVKNILWTGIMRDTADWREWQKLIEEERANIKIAESSQKISWRRSDLRGFIEVLWPLENLEGQEFENSNETSVVLRLVFGQNSFLFTGDIGEKTERELTNQNIDSDVLKVAHHGSRYSSSENFLKKVSPAIAIIQVGENNYGHPHPEVLARLEEFGIENLTTKKIEDIKIISDGLNLKY